MQIGTFRGFGQTFPFINQPSPTQSVWEPDPNIDNVRVAVPPNQWVTGPMSIHAMVPTAQSAFGPVPNDYELARTRPYLPYHKGWINTESDGSVYTIQGPPVGQSASDTAIRWSIAASVISAVALATTTLIAVLRYREGKK